MSSTFIFVLLGSLVTIIEAVTLHHQVIEPNGYLLALKALSIDDPRKQSYYNHVSLFKIELNGKVTELWNYSCPYPHIIFTENNFAIDLENELVYLGIVDQFLALDMYTGKIKITIPLQPPNLQYFWNYDYHPQDNAIYGICTGNRLWNWCRVSHNGTHNVVHVDMDYQMPYTGTYGPIDGPYSVDQKHHLIYYLPSYIQTFGIGVNYTTGDVIFVSGPADPICIGYDHELNKTFTINRSELTLAQLHPDPKPEEKLLDLPSNLRTYFGCCVYDPESHTMFVLASNITDSLYHSMPSALLVIDTLNLSYKRIPLPAFYKNWDSGWPITAVKYIPNKN